MIRYVFTGEEERDERGRYILPQNATHVSVHPSVKVIPANLFSFHQNIVELICHAGVIKIEEEAFCLCPRLKRVIMRGVEDIGERTFCGCDALTDVECPKLERIEECVFDSCKSLSDIDLSSVKNVEEEAFSNCEALTDVKFGSNLESLESMVFTNCPSLEKITIPLKNDLFTDDSVFEWCANLKCVDLVEGAVLHDTAAALLLEIWTDDMNGYIDSINHVLPNAPAGYINDEDDRDVGEKALEIREWITDVLEAIIDYKAEHRRLVKVAASLLRLALPNDIVTNHVVPFLELPLHTFDGENEEESINSSDDGNEFAFQEYEDEEEDEDGDNKSGEVHNAPADGGDDDDQHQQQDDEGGRNSSTNTTPSVGSILW